MGASVRVESTAAGGAEIRILRFGRSLAILWGAQSVPRQAAYDLGLGTCVRLWSYLTDRETDVTDDETVDDVAGLSGVATLLVDSGLAKRTRAKKLKLCGGERLLWLKKKREAGRKAGKKGGRPKKGDPLGDPLPNNKGDPFEKETPIATALVTAPALVTAQELDLGKSGGARRIPAIRGVPLETVKSATETVVGAFNRALDRRLTATPWRDAIARVLARGHTVEEMKAVVWWASEEWSDDEKMRKGLSPKTLLKFSSSQGYRTFPEYLGMADELWRETHDPSEPAPWARRKSA